MGREFLSAMALLLIASSTPSLSAEPIGMLLAAGDIGNCYSENTKHEETAALIGRQIAEQPKDFPIRVLVLGDLAYADPDKRKTYEECFKAFEGSWGKYKNILLPVPGNHDYHDDAKKNASTYKAYFADTLEALEAKDGAYYSYSFPKQSPHAWLLIGLNRYEQWTRQ